MELNIRSIFESEVYNNNYSRLDWAKRRANFIKFAEIKSFQSPIHVRVSEKFIGLAFRRYDFNSAVDPWPNSLVRLLTGKK